MQSLVSKELAERFAKAVSCGDDRVIHVSIKAGKAWLIGPQLPPIRSLIVRLESLVEDGVRSVKGDWESGNQVEAAIAVLAHKMQQILL